MTLHFDHRRAPIDINDAVERELRADGLARRPRSSAGIVLGRPSHSKTHPEVEITERMSQNVPMMSKDPYFWRASMAREASVVLMLVIAFIGGGMSQVGTGLDYITGPRNE